MIKLVRHWNGKRCTTKELVCTHKHYEFQARNTHRAGIFNGTISLLINNGDEQFELETMDVDEIEKIKKACEIALAARR